MVILTGHTQIKNGITFSRCETVPDAPISTFELNLPQGPYSALGANLSPNAKGNFCNFTKAVTTRKRVAVRRKGRTVHVVKSVTTQVGSLIMPTTITGQNGAVLNQNTKISVLGCLKAHKATIHHKAKKAN